MLVAPTEPRAFDALGRRALRPELHGVDFYFIANKLPYGVQRKELRDFIASATDGRLSKEVAQMQSLAQSLLVIEGTPRWTLDGELVIGGFTQRWTRAAHLAYVHSIRARGVWVDWSTDHAGTIEVIRAFEEWVRKPKHRALDTRPGPVNAWGTPTNRDFQRHLVQGINGIGPENADAILDALGMPFGLVVSEDELMSVPGIGPKKARAIARAFEVSGT